MNRGKAKAANQKNVDSVKPKRKNGSISYRLKCNKTANGLSHFVMYGDMPKEKTLL